MKSTLRTEVWRIVKYILIGGLLNLAFTLSYSYMVSPAVLESDAPGRLMTVWTYVQLLLSTTAACLIHRYFTFRASEKWYIALPLMLLFALGMRMLTSMVMALAGRLGTAAVITASQVISPVATVLAYLFQRYVIYCHSTDEGGWYRRFHPTNEEEGAYPYE